MNTKRFEILELLDGMRLGPSPKDVAGKRLEFDLWRGSVHTYISPGASNDRDVWSSSVISLEPGAIAILGCLMRVSVLGICECGQSPSHKYELGCVNVSMTGCGKNDTSGELEELRRLYTDERTPSKVIEGDRRRIWMVDFDFCVPIQLSEEDTVDGRHSLSMSHNMWFASTCPTSTVRVAIDLRVRYAILK